MDKVINYRLLKEKRNEKRISIRSFAKMLGVSHNLVNSWENQTIKTLKPEIEKKIKKILGIEKDLYIPVEKGKVFLEGRGNFLKKMRKARGITIAQLSEKIGKSKSTICKWEKGKIGSIPEKDIENICIFFGISEIEFYTQSVLNEKMEILTLVSDKQCEYSIDDIVTYGKNKFKIKKILEAGITPEKELYIKLSVVNMLMEGN